MSDSTLAEALASWAADPSDAGRDACFQAIRHAFVFLCAAAPGTDRTGREPQFSLSTVSGRTFLISQVETLGRSLFVFSERREAEAWCRRVPGYLAEPIPAVAAADFAVRSDAVLTIDPTTAAFLVDRGMMQWGLCPRRPLAKHTFLEVFEAWMADRTPRTLADLSRVTADTVFYVIENTVPPQGIPAAVVYGRTLATDELDGVTYLSASTDRSVVDGWCEGTVSRTFAMDGPALFETAAQLGVDVGVMIGAQRALGVGPHDEGWPRRTLGPSDF